MKDYFRPFIVERAREATSALGMAQDSDKIKTHLMWALTAGGIGYVCFKGGQWYSTYKLVKKKMSE